ncbi:MAG: hypothetical protein CSB55_01765 [Candidatus Cloacimonadota bacterium]|nr:MAG: hypothetical protein CSB55_01765 [Candidatus Cloacimonadota bacterium]
MSSFHDLKKKKISVKPDAKENVFSASIDFTGRMKLLNLERKVFLTPYNRKMDRMERKIFEQEAFSYLLNFVQNDSIDEIMFERIIGLCLSLEMFLHEKIDLKKMTQIVEVISSDLINDNIAKDLADIIVGRFEVVKSQSLIN